MGSILTLSIVGYVGGDVVVRDVGEQRVASFSVAVNRKTSSGEQQTLWVRVNCWNKLADVAAEYVHKGSSILATSSWMRTSAWIDQSGNPQAGLDINADRLVLLDRVASDTPDDEEDLANVPF